MPSPVTFNTAARRASESQYPWAWPDASWPLFEGGGSTAFDFSCRGRNLTTSGGPTWGSNGLTFNGSQHAKVLSVPVTSAPCTLLGWVTSTNTTQIQTVLALTLVGSAGITHNLRIGLRGDVVGNPVFAQSNPGGLAQGGAYSSGVEFCLACVFASSTSRTLYVNGIPVATDTASSTPTGLAQTIIGATYDSSALPPVYVQGLIGTVRGCAVYSRALKQEELLELAILGPNAHLIPRRRRSAFAVTSTPTTSRLLTLRRRSAA